MLGKRISPVVMHRKHGRYVSTSEKGAARGEAAQGTTTQSHISPGIIVYDDYKGTLLNLEPTISDEAQPYGSGRRQSASERKGNNTKI